MEVMMCVWGGASNGIAVEIDSVDHVILFSQTGDQLGLDFLFFYRLGPVVVAVEVEEEAVVAVAVAVVEVVGTAVDCLPTAKGKDIAKAVDSFFGAIF
jgi:hypothetical protein